MTKKRQAQFEADRQKMMQAIGAEADEKLINTEEVEVEESQELADYGEKLEALKADNPSPAEYQARIDEAYTEFVEDEKEVTSLPREKRENARKMRHNKHVRSQKRLTEFGKADGYGWMVAALDQFQATFGGGVIFKVLLIATVIPVWSYWNAVGNTPFAFIVAIISAFLCRFACCFLSYPARAFVTFAVEIGPRFVCDIREGNPAVKLWGSILNKMAWCFVHAYIPMFAIALWFQLRHGLPEESWLMIYATKTAYAVVFASVMWFVGNVFGYVGYVNAMRNLITGKVRYRLRYLHDCGRVMVATRNGPIVGKSELQRAFRRDAHGIA
jgi:hypothetical protein